MRAQRGEQRGEYDCRRAAVHAEGPMVAAVAAVAALDERMDALPMVLVSSWVV